MPESAAGQTSAAGGLGAVWRRGGVDFRLRAPAADLVELCLFSAREPAVERRRIALERAPGGVWHRRVEGEGPGRPYAYRVDGPFAPDSGHFFERDKLLLDPRAGAIAGRPSWSPALVPGSGVDSAPFTARSVVIDPRFDWADDRRPRVPWEHTLIYECHVRGLTRLHPRVPEKLRGTYLGLAQPPVIEHLLALGVTTVELMPVQHFVAERHLLQSGRRNYWGYSPIGWFAPHAAYATGERGRQVREFKTMVRELHRAGLEVLLDVVVNHTAEGGAAGLTLGPRGIDNRGFYRSRPQDPSRLVDYTGCGNTVDLRDAATRGLVLDALRYWATEMRVDGFRFDLAGVLGREDERFSPAAPFFRQLAQDPELAGLKLIAEPWDLGPGGYLAGRFPPAWREWNDRYRDALRAFWRGDAARAADVATRLAGSSDIYAGRSGGPQTGINYVACHDGFTLQDLVSYRRKHNWANGERNRDGSLNNLSHHWGVEGATDDEAIRARRRRAKRNLLASLALSAGVPMLGHGDEMGRTQGGNNNAYCHDSPLTWVDWELDAERRQFLAFTRDVFALRRRLAIFSRREFFSAADLAWLDLEGRPLAPDDWRRPDLRTLVAVHRGSGGGVLLALNADRDKRTFRPRPQAAAPFADGWSLPSPRRWRLLLATVDGVAIAADRLTLPAYSLLVVSLEGDASGRGDG